MDKVLAIAAQEVGYLEKNKGQALDPQTPGGDGNYTKYWRDLSPSLQGSYWCLAFVIWCFVEAYGKEKALAMLNLKSYDFYTPSAAKKGYNGNLWHTDPCAGDIIYFCSDSYKSTRWKGIHHVGIVEKVEGNYVYTIEGNTSSTAGVERNGGCVARKKYEIGNANIAGYVRPDYGLVGTKNYTTGWNYDESCLKWWYADSKITYLNNCWQTINGHWYYFDADGYAVTGLQTINDKRYFFEDVAGSPLECALMHTDKNGAFEVWNV